MKKKNGGFIALKEITREGERASCSDRIIGLNMEQRRALSMATVAWHWRRPVTGALSGHDPGKCWCKRKQKKKVLPMKKRDVGTGSAMR